MKFKIVGPFFICVPAAIFSLRSTALAQDSTQWKLEIGGTFSTFQQQVKAEVGDPRGERLINETDVGVMMMGRYQILDFLSAGLFLQFDRGHRLAARFDGFNSEGMTVTKDKLGGNYSEAWFGPFVHFSWKNLFAEGGYGAFGRRSDDARGDLASSTGDTTSSFSLHPTIALLAALGAGVQITDDLDLIVRMEYRLRYYTMRGGNTLKNNIEHGTQNITPFVGVSWRF
ncbi:MAG: hypothetical protein HYY49_05315 [Ignavibacteriales bacterium]|nr:hypothetical protein [Ignavibacteriales bacterium]